MRDWQRLRIGEHIAFLSGFPFPSEFFGYEEGMPLVRIRDLATSAIETRYAGPYNPKWVVNAGDILIGMDGDFSIVRWRNSDALLNQRILLADAKPGGKIDKDFFFYWCGLALTRIHARTAATTVKHLSVRDLDKASDLFPSFEQQQRIAEILSTVDEATEQTEALIAKTQQIKAGVMYDLFTRGVTADGQTRPPREEAPQIYKQSPLGWIPKDWDFDHLGELTTRIVDGVHHTPSYVEHGVPFVTVKNLTSSRSIDFADLNYISRRDHEEFIRRADPTFGDVLVTKDGTLGVSRLVETWHPEFSIFVSVAMLRPIVARLRPQMLHMFFDCGAYERQLGHLSAGTGLKHIHLEHFRRFVVPLPPLDEQDRIAGIASSIECKLMEEEIGLEKLKRLKRGLMHDLLSGRTPATAGAPADIAEVAANV